MDNIEWECKKFTELNVTELYEIMKIRSQVFVVEQNCIYLDADDKDALSFHLFTKHAGTVAAYARLLPPGLAFKEASIGRVISAPSQRRNGFGILLMQEAITKTLHLYCTNKIKIGAQLYLQSFYESLQFEKCSEQYDEDGIPHIEMILHKK